MSDGGAGVLAELLKIPVVREITLVMMWFWGLSYAIDHRQWAWFALVAAVGLIVGWLYWFLYNRKKKKTGGGEKLLSLGSLAPRPLLLRITS